MPFNPTHRPGRAPVPPGKKGTANPAADAATLLVREAAAARRQGRNNEALRLARQALGLDGGNLAALSLAGEILLVAGRKADAEPLLARAVALKPDDAVLAHMYGVALYQMDKPTDAADMLSRAVALDAGNAQAFSALGAALQKTGRLGEAMAAYDNAASLDPGDADIQVNISSAALRLADWAGAEAATARALALRPDHRRALAYRAIALTELGRRDEAALILDYDRLARLVDFTDADAGGDLAGLNRALVAHVERHPELTYEPVLKATTGGSQTPDLLAGDRGPVARLEAMVRREIDRYIAAADPARHPYLGHAPSSYRLVMWGTYLKSQGRQAPHIHPGAWLSGVYYPALPPEMGTGAGAHDGWIEFGRGGDEFPATAEPVLRLFEPVEGRLILFPSYMFHRTYPFESEAPRVSIALDVEPVA
jgi:Flp pilus assembly protein TadD